MSVVGQNRKCLRRRGISVLPPTADIGTPTAQVGFVPDPDMGLLFNCFVGTCEHCGCNFETERLGGVDIDH